jgi:hypothetical protein
MLCVSLSLSLPPSYLPPPADLGYFQKGGCGISLGFSFPLHFFFFWSACPRIVSLPALSLTQSIAFTQMLAYLSLSLLSLPCLPACRYPFSFNRTWRIFCRFTQIHPRAFRSGLNSQTDGWWKQMHLHLLLRTCVRGQACHPIRRQR